MLLCLTEMSDLAVLVSIAMAIQSYYHCLLDKELNDVRSLVLKLQTHQETFDAIAKNLEESKIITEFANHMTELKSRLDDLEAVQSNHSTELEKISDGFSEMKVRLGKLSEENVAHKTHLEIMLNDVQSLKAAQSTYTKNRLEEEKSVIDSRDKHKTDLEIHRKDINDINSNLKNLQKEHAELSMKVRSNHFAELDRILDGYGDMEVRLTKLSRESVVQKNNIEIMSDDLQSLQAAQSKYRKNRLEDERSMKELWGMHEADLEIHNIDIRVIKSSLQNLQKEHAELSLKVRSNHYAELDRILDGFGDMEVRLTKLSKESCVHKNHIEVMSADLESLQAAQSRYRKDRIEDEITVKELWGVHETALQIHNIDIKVIKSSLKNLLKEHAKLSVVLQILGSKTQKLANYQNEVNETCNKKIAEYSREPALADERTECEPSLFLSSISRESSYRYEYSK